MYKLTLIKSTYTATPNGSEKVSTMQSFKCDAMSELLVLFSTLVETSQGELEMKIVKEGK